ncbi:ABC transporter, transmembrane domain, type 1 [Tolypocladium paradoxum]|uniref:ABC transporter, transmembrane domain, type 1 n=1 Tax=Tolypocladium paradoxum TaxID=94208 RepID=A0A2S4L0B8_9HYPO|nr:ABC transporter, transmembrane domain, type 1 [Tolypocladium paradoxum]
MAVIASGAKYVAAVIPFFAVALYFLQKYYLRTSRQIRLLDLESKSPLYTQFTETAAGIQHIRAFGWHEEFLAHSLELLDYSQKPYYYMYCVQRWLTLVLDLCVLCIAVTLVAIGLNFTNTTTQGAIGLALISVIGFSEGLSLLINSWTELETSLGAIARLRSFVDETPTEQDPRGEQARELPDNWPSHGKIELQGVSARYNASDDASRPVLDGISAVIQPGQKVGIVGRTGRLTYDFVNSGKSSLILTMLNLLHCYSGSVKIDGIDISQIASRQQLRSRITTLAQDPIELPGSVRSNLVPFASANPQTAGADEAAVIDALSRVGIWEHISSHGGLDADLAAMGLSHGQKQLLCLARAVLHNASTGSRVVLVDEATSSVDGETDARMQAVMSEAFAGCTLVVVAHRLETIQDADVVLELDAGRLVQLTLNLLRDADEEGFVPFRLLEMHDVGDLVFLAHCAPNMFCAPCIVLSSHLVVKPDHGRQGQGLPPPSPPFPGAHARDAEERFPIL